jgi:hypothetical protein
MRRSMISLWWRDSNQTASGKPGAVHLTPCPIFQGHLSLLIRPLASLWRFESMTASGFVIFLRESSFFVQLEIVDNIDIMF